MIRIVTLLFLIFSLNAVNATETNGCVSDQAQQPAFDAFAAADPNLPYSQGLLWRLEQAGQIKGHIFGTIHLDYPSVTRLPPPVRLALAQSRSVLLETVLDEAAHRTYMQGIYYRDAGTLDLKTVLSDALYQKATRLLTAYGLPEHRQIGLKPWAVFSMLGRPRPSSGIVQDEVLRQLATRSGKLVYGMETMQQLIASLDSITPDDQITILIDTLCQHDKLMSSVRDLVAIYAARNLAALQAFNNQPHADEAVFARFMQAMLEQRNDRMQESILSHLQEGDVFIAVGAMHLPGEQGLLSRIADAGYTVTPVF